jgi:hypothetical protein
MLGQGLIYAVLELGALCGMPMSPDDIEQLMSVNRPAVVQSQRTDDGDGEGGM